MAVFAFMSAGYAHLVSASMCCDREEMGVQQALLSQFPSGVPPDSNRPLACYPHGIFPMQQRAQNSALTHVLCALLACALLACAPATPPADPASNSADTSTDSDADAPPAQSAAKVAHSAHLVQRAQAGRAAKILDARGAPIALLVPEDFGQILSVPDIANNTSDMISQRVSGTDIVAVSVEEGTGRILLAVRGFLYAEVSTDLVFLLQTKGSPEAPASKTAGSPWAIEPVYFDGPGAEQSGDGARPHLDVTRVSFEEDGHLLINTDDASGGSAQLVYGADLTPQSCTWTSGESRRCPKGISPQ